MKKVLIKTTTILGWSLLILCAAYQIAAGQDLTPGGLLQFDVRSEFERSFPGLPTEDFEESPVASLAMKLFAEPLNSATNVPGAFSPGDILAGLTIQTVEGAHPDDSLLVAGSDWAANTSHVVGPNYAADTLEIRFSGNAVHAAGMELLLADAPGTVTITIYGEGNVILDTLPDQPVQTSETFFGFYSPQLITRITVAAGSHYELVDDIQFGTIARNITFLTDRTLFENAHPGLTREDFEESPVTSGSLVKFPEPLDSTTDAPGAFSPGDIVEGLMLRTMGTEDPTTSLVVIGDHLVPMNNASKMICSYYIDDNLVFFFNTPNTPVYATGMDLMPAMESGTTTAHVIVFGSTGRILGTTTLSLAPTGEKFLGVQSNYLIAAVAVITGKVSARECVDNIQFGGSPVDLTFFTTETEFKKVRSSLPVEDFSESTVTDGVSQLCDEPINSSSSQAHCFSPGDINPLISFQTVDSVGAGCPTCMVVVGRNAGIVGNAKPLLGAAPPDTLEISFTGNNIYFAGMKLYYPDPVQFSVYDTNGALLGEAIRNVTDLGDFWGVQSAKPIGRIAAGNPTIIGEVQFGSKFPWAMFIPQKNTAQ